MELATLKKTLYSAVCGVSIAFTAGSGFLSAADYIRSFDIVIQKNQTADDESGFIEDLGRKLLNLN